MKRIRKAFVLLSICFLFIGCGSQGFADGNASLNTDSEYDSGAPEKEGVSIEEAAPIEEGALIEEAVPVEESVPIEDAAGASIGISIDDIPAYFGQAYIAVNENIPYFEDGELSAESYEYYSELDSLGRCGVCVASVGQDIMPTQEREEIGSVKPSGWKTAKYPGIVDGNYLYNRCHLIGYQLTGENANAKNLITGTRYMNMDGMLPFENMVADYVKETSNHVMYRVTPVFKGQNLVADGVLMEAKSVEDNGAGILFNVFCYNVQPGIIIDYANGDSMADGAEAAEEESRSQPLPEPEIESVTIQPETAQPQPEASAAEAGAYAVNGKNGKIHMTGACPATGNSSRAMKSPVYFNTYEEAEAYSISIDPNLDDRKCGNCW